MWSRRIGRFRIGFNDITEYPEKVIKLLSGMLIIKAEAELHDMSIHYMAVAPYFDEVELGCDPPEYGFTHSNNELFLLDESGDKL